jgi:hypothetical protein
MMVVLVMNGATVADRARRPANLPVSTSMSTCASAFRERLHASLGKLLLVLWTLAVAACGGDGSTRICFGSDEFCGRAFDGNRPPLADAGTDQEVVSGRRVLLDGSASRDPDGHITAYAWTQESGPAVALEQAATAVARFDAPVVAVATALTFRLLVTDNRGSSAVDRVQVTVRPAAIGALTSGLTLLKEAMRPAALVGTADPEDAAFIGLWLGARVEAAAAGYENGIDRLLDELRVVMVAHADAAEPREAKDLLALAKRAVAAFTAERDPATAALAGGIPTPPVTPEDWASALAKAVPQLAGEDAPLDALQQAAVRLLLGDLSRASADQVAAATLAVALRAQASPAPVPD